MKNIALFFCLAATVSFSQTKTTVASGNFWNPLNWDCTCLPADGDSLVINHDIDMTSGIAYTMGQIHVSSSGTLSDGGTDYDIYINGGSFINDGSVDFDGLWLDTGWIINNGSMNLDSLLTQSTMTNSGTITTFDFLHDQLADFTSTGDITVTNNFNNEGNFSLSGVMTVSNDASNCNIQSSQAMFDNDGIFCVTGDFANCLDDTLRGSGTFYIGGFSTNTGQVEETLTINTTSGGFSVNTGTVAGTVTFGTAACGVGLEEEEEYDEAEIDWSIYPNPATSIIQSSEQSVNYTIYDLTGRTVITGKTFNGTIHIDGLAEGNYSITLENNAGVRSTKTFIKL